MSISTHVLDAVTGRPATAVPVTLLDATAATLAEARTDHNGRIGALGGELPAGVYRLRFDTAAYFTAQNVTGFYPEIVIAFEITDEEYPQITEIRLSAPNKHHFALHLTPFGLENHNEVFHADDRPYGLIQATVTRDDATPPGAAWDLQQGRLG